VPIYQLTIFAVFSESNNVVEVAYMHDIKQNNNKEYASGFLGHFFTSLDSD